MPVYPARFLALLLLPVCVASYAAPLISRQPVDTQVTTGQNATLAVEASGAPPIGYQWRRRGSSIFGATDATLVLPAVTRGEEGFYDVVVSDATGTTASSTARVLVSPAAYPTLIMNDTNAELALLRDSIVQLRAFAPMPDGGFVAAGRFGSVNGQRRTHVIRVQKDGAINEAFAPMIVGAEAMDVDVQPDGKIVVAGSFSHVNGHRRHSLVRLNSDGTTDPSFAPSMDEVDYSWKVLLLNDGRLLVASISEGLALRRLMPDGSADPSWNSSVTGRINDMALQPDGKLVIAGQLYAGSGREIHAARINTDGSVDDTFNVGNLKGIAYSAAVDAQGRILLGGSTFAVDGHTRRGLIRLRQDGTIDPFFECDVAYAGGGGAGTVYSLATQADGKVLMAGFFESVGGTLRPSVARIDTNGVVDSFAAIPGNLLASSIAVMPDGSVLAGTSNLSPSGKKKGFDRYTSGGIPADLRYHDFVDAGGGGLVVALPGGKHVMFGSFNWVSRHKTQGIARLNADGSVDRSYVVAVSDGLVNAAAALGDGRVVAVGAFNSIAGRTSPRAAILRGDGSVDPGFWPLSGSLTDPRAVTVTKEGKIAAAGGVSPEAGQSGEKGALVIYNLNGSFAFDSGAQFDGAIHSILALPDGRLVVGGSFKKYRGEAAIGIAAFHPDGTRDATFAPQMENFQEVRHLALSPTGRIYVVWSNFGPGVMARYNADGTEDRTYAHVSTGLATSVLVQGNDHVIVRSRVGLDAARGDYVARFRPDGHIDPTFVTYGIGKTFFHPVNGSMVMRDDGQLIISDFYHQVYVTRAGAAPRISEYPAAQYLNPGADGTLSTKTDSPIPVTYQWFLDGAPIPGATEATYRITDFTRSKVGEYSVATISAFGSVRSNGVRVDAPRYEKGRLMNLSVRSNAGSDAKTLIVGVVLGGAGTSGPKPLLIRGVGPTLSLLGVADYLPDPALKLHDGAGFMVDQNDDWTGVFDFTSLGAFAYAGVPPKDAAIYNPYAAAGAQTVHLVGKGAATGVALAEIYDASAGGSANVFTPRLINGSARTEVGKGSNVLILGFVLGGNTNEKVLVRGVGPRLAAAPFNITSALNNPKLEVFDSAGKKILENDNWGDDGKSDALRAAFDSVGAFGLATGSKDSALVAELPPGAYTAVVSGVDETTGIGLVELYELP